MITQRATTFAVSLALAITACAPDAPAADGPAGGVEETAPATADTGAVMDEEGQDTAWIALFDGTDLSAWRGYGQDDVPAGWQVRDGVLVFDPAAGDGGDIVTRESFGDFELVLDWRIGPGGNSGIFYRVDEDAEIIWHHAPEIQILDDAGHADGVNALTSAGAAYALYPPTEDAVNPPGEWNHVRIVANGPRVEHWMNGSKIVEYEIGSPDWNRRVAASKFAEFPRFAAAMEGPIGLQDHGDMVWFREIKVRRIEKEAP